jgi:type IV pilus assembly protein PilC
MLFSRRLSLATLIEVCRTMRHSLAAGLRLLDVLRQLSQRGPLSARPVCANLLDHLKQGKTFEEALERERTAFPPLFVSMAIVGEQSGALPEVIAELEKYFVLQQRLKRQFIQQIAWPAFQFIAAIFVIAAMLFVLGLLGLKMDPLGIGLTGETGALIWLVSVFGILAALTGLYILVTRSLKRKALVDFVLLRLPVIGPCLEALALERFCIALRMTLETGMPITAALRLSLRATGNAAFVARAEPVIDAVRGGEELTLALATSRLFPYEFQNIIAVAEESGRLAEVLRHQADYYDEEASRRMKLLTSAAAVGVWLMVALIIIIMIFRIFFGVILKAYDAAGG